MSAHTLHRRGLIPAILILLALGYWWLRPHPPKIIAIGYVADRNVTVWNTLALVRQPIEELHYGDRVEVVRQEGTAAQVHTASGALGWLLDTRQMMDSALWGQSAALFARARTMPVQARGQTKAVSNVRVEPGRNGRRIFQFMRGTPVLVLRRAIADAPQSNDEISSDEKVAGGEEQKPKKEDWLLVLRAENPIPASAASTAGTRSMASAGPVSGGPRSRELPSPTAGSPAPSVAGWVLARFIEPDLPGPVRDYATSATLRVVAWFELNRVPDGSGGEAPQYLVALSRGGQGQACDFTMLRVYTWGSVRKRYETAYVESNLCGRLPIQVSRTPAGPQFHFAEAGENTAERNYIMRLTTVRRIKGERDESVRRR
jgi:hypothetical protein